MPKTVLITSTKFNSLFLLDGRHRLVRAQEYKVVAFFSLNFGPSVPKCKNNVRVTNQKIQKDQASRISRYVLKVII